MYRVVELPMRHKEIEELLNLMEEDGFELVETFKRGEVCGIFRKFAGLAGISEIKMPPPISVTVQAMDAKGFIDNADKIADAVNAALQKGHHPLSASLRNADDHKPPKNKGGR